MAHPQIAVFARLADGNDQRLRAIEGQATMLGRTMHAISYDPIHDEIFVPQQFGQGILTFAGDATGETPPKRAIMGPKTQLIALDRLGVDPVNNEIYVPEGKRLLVFDREAHGDVAPKRVLEGPDTGIHAARAVAIDTKHNLLIVSAQPPPRPGRRARPAPGQAGEAGENTGEDEGQGGRRGMLLIFDRTASGNAKPLRAITSAAAGQNIAVHPDTGYILVVRAGNIGVWHIDDSGDVPPRFTIGGPNGVLREPRGVTVDAKNRTVLVSDKELNAALTFYVPEMFEGVQPTGSGRQR